MIAEATTEPKCIAEKRENLERALASLVTVAPHVEAAQSVFGDRWHMWLGDEGTQVHVALHLDDYRDVVPYLQQLAKLGYRQNERAYYEAADLAHRCYERGNIEVWVYLTGQKCKRVIVGEKTVPVYAIQCGETAEQTA